MTNVKGNSAGLARWALALATVLAADVMAQTGSDAQAESRTRKSPDRRVEAMANVVPGGFKTIAAATAVQRPNVAVADDMRLWSFGDCDRRFPYVDMDEHKECVGIVGSAEARDVRAHHVCEVSHDKDPAEIERCKSAYKANRERAAKEGFLPDSPGVQQAPAPPEATRRGEAITPGTVERNRTTPSAATEPARANVAEAADSNAQSDTSSSLTMVGALGLAVLLLGIGATVVRRNQAGSA